jgi:hypothetical protein
MANAEVVAIRRDNIAQRWLKGQSVASIAAETGEPLGTVKHDLHFVRQAMLAGTGDVVRLTRSRSMATIELVAAQAWQRLDALSAQDEPDDGALTGYLNVVLKAEAHAAKLAGIGGAPSFILERLLNTDLHTWLDAQDKAKERAELRALQRYDDEDEEDEPDEEDEYERGKADGYARGLAEGAKQANEVYIAAIHEVVDGIRAETAPAEPEPELDATPAESEPEPVEAEPVPEPVVPPPPPPRGPRPPARGFDAEDQVDDADDEDLVGDADSWIADWERTQAKAGLTASALDRLVAEARARAQNGRQT